MTSLKEQPSGAGYAPKILLLELCKAEQRKRICIKNLYTSFFLLPFLFLMSLFVFAAASIISFFVCKKNGMSNRNPKHTTLTQVIPVSSVLRNFTSNKNRH